MQTRSRPEGEATLELLFDPAHVPAAVSRPVTRPPWFPLFVLLSALAGVFWMGSAFAAEERPAELPYPELLVGANHGGVSPALECVARHAGAPHI